MKKNYVLAVIVLLMLIACQKGSDSPTAPSAAAPSINYGTLTLSGTGSSTAGTTFTPAKVEFVASGTDYKWMTESFPYSGGHLEVVSFLGQKIVTFTYVSPYVTWSKSSASGVTINTSSVTFNNVILPGEMNTTTSLTLNGTLKFQ